MSIEEQFKKFGDEEFMKFECINNPQFKTPKLCGLVALEKLVGNKIDFAAEHDKVWCAKCNRDLTLSDEEVIYLLRCGILWDDEFEGFFFFT